MKKSLLLIGTAALSLSAVADDVQVSGFINVGGGKLSDEDAGSYAGYSSEDMTFDADTVFGLQVSKQVSDKLTATGQLVARGAQDYELDAAWVYVKYQVNDNFSWRAGRFQSPFYFFSDFLNVGYAYTWIRPPVEVYNIQQRSVTGVDFLSDFSIGDFSGSFQGYYGAENGDQTLSSGDSARRDVKNQYGLIFSGNWEWFSFRAAHHEADLTIDTTNVEGFDDLVGLLRFNGFNATADILEPVDDAGTFDSVAIGVDTGTFIAMYETAKLDFKDNFGGVDNRWYLMLGLRLGDWTPYVTHVVADDDVTKAIGLEDLDSAVFDPLPGGLTATVGGLVNSFVDHHETDSIGVRWDFTTSAAFKLQVDKVEYDDDSGVLAGESQRLISFAVQTVF